MERVKNLFKDLEKDFQKGKNKDANRLAENYQKVRIKIAQCLNDFSIAKAIRFSQGEQREREGILLAKSIMVKSSTRREYNHSGREKKCFLS